MFGLFCVSGLAMSSKGFGINDCYNLDMQSNIVMLLVGG